MRRSRRLTGFTLVELLVVITIIGLLAALIVPAVSSAIETARKNTCSNNLRQIGEGAIAYSTRKGYFPGYINPKFNSSQTANTSWQIALLNDLDRASNYKAWIENDATQINANAPYLEIYVCSSDNTAVGQTGPFTSFVVNTGKTGDQTDSTEVLLGVCHNLADATNAKQRRIALDGFPDGASVTLLASENLDADKYTSAAENVLGFQFGTANPYINKTGGTGRPSSNHSGSVNVVFAGGNTKSIDNLIDFKIWNALMTPDGNNKNVTMADKNNQQIPLQEGSY